MLRFFIINLEAACLLLIVAICIGGAVYSIYQVVLK